MSRSLGEERRVGAIALGKLGGIGLDLTTAFPAPHYQPDPTSGDGAERHRRAGHGFHRREDRGARAGSFLVRACAASASPSVILLRGKAPRIIPALSDDRFGEGFRMPAVHDYPRALRAGVRKPPRKEPAGRWAGGCRLWGFDGAAVWVGDALAGVVGGGPTIAVASLSLRRRPTEQFWRDRRCSTCLWSRRGDSDAMPEARRMGSREVW
jgi:hypothetical protein